MRWDTSTGFQCNFIFVIPVPFYLCYFSFYWFDDICSSIENNKTRILNGQVWGLSLWSYAKPRGRCAESALAVSINTFGANSATSSWKSNSSNRHNNSSPHFSHPELWENFDRLRYGEAKVSEWYCGICSFFYQPPPAPQNAYMRDSITVPFLPSAWNMNSRTLFSLPTVLFFISLLERCAVPSLWRKASVTSEGYVARRLRSLTGSSPPEKDKKDSQW